MKSMPADRVACLAEEFAVSDPAAEFSVISSVAFDSDGRIYVSDALESHITVLEPDGAVAQRIGQRGRGPGEFQRTTQVQILPGDSLFAFDPELSRVTVFPPNRTDPAYTVNLAERASFGRPDWIAKIHSTNRMLAAYSGGLSPEHDDHGLNIVRLLEADGSLVQDSVLLFPGPQMLTAEMAGRMMSVPNPFGAAGLVRMGPDGQIIYSWTDSLGIEVYGLDGNPVGAFVMDHPGVPVTEQDIAATFAHFPGGPPPGIRQHVPDRWPAIKDVVVDDAGRMWVGLITPPTEEQEWILLETDGEYVCSLLLPPSRMRTTVTAMNSGIRAASHDRIYTVEIDPETDAPGIVVYQITFPALSHGLHQ